MGSQWHLICISSLSPVSPPIPTSELPDDSNSWNYPRIYGYIKWIQCASWNSLSLPCFGNLVLGLCYGGNALPSWSWAVWLPEAGQLHALLFSVTSLLQWGSGSPTWKRQPGERNGAQHKKMTPASSRFRLPGCLNIKWTNPLQNIRWMGTQWHLLTHTLIPGSPLNPWKSILSLALWKSSQHSFFKHQCGNGWLKDNLFYLARNHRKTGRRCRGNHGVSFFFEMYTFPGIESRGFFERLHFPWTALLSLIVLSSCMIGWWLPGLLPLLP